MARLAQAGSPKGEHLAWLVPYELLFRVLGPVRRARLEWEPERVLLDS